MQLLILPLLLLAMYFLVIRPQQQRIRAQQAVVAALEEGDEVISSAGIYGRIVELTDEVAVLEVADGVEIRIARGAIARRVEPAGAYDEDEDGYEGEDDGDVVDLDGVDLDDEAELEPSERDEPGAAR